MFKRVANILKSNNFFLFGARGTGKTTLVRELFKEEKFVHIDLLSPSTEELYLLQPEALEQLVAVEGFINPKWIIIDEIQKAPKLLDVVHGLIEHPQNQKRAIKFALTGSSARKLKRGASNLLAGRAFTYELYPLSYQEIGEQFNIAQTLAWGSLPAVVNAENNSERSAFLKSYARTYLKEEIIEEQLVRSIVPFRRFLPVAAQCNGTIVNINKIARDLGVDWTTVRNYFDILEDTLLGFQLPAYSKSLRKQQLSSPKFYLFDTGVTRALDKTLNLELTSGQMIGPLFEQFIVCEMHRLNSYFDRDFSFSYLATQGGLEIDLVVERPGEKTALVEIKSSDRITSSHIKHLKEVTKSKHEFEAYCFCQEKHVRKDGSIIIAPWQQGFEMLGLV